MSRHPSTLVLHAQLALGLLVAALASSCDSHPVDRPCEAIAEDYKAALPEAMTCNPADPAPCSGAVPMVVSLEHPDGTQVAEGLCLAPCLAAVNPGLTVPLGQLVREYERSGCTYRACWCPAASSMPPSCEPGAGMCWGIAPAP